MKNFLVILFCGSVIWQVIAEMVGTNMVGFCVVVMASMNWWRHINAW